jgi:2-amino-4-hydroxy-6-hydroxymethyldihydropteridine diphosphokinase
LAEAFLLLGSNLGNREEILRQARVVLAERAGKLLQESAVYETAAWGNQNQGAFLNQVLKLETSHSPLSLLAVIQKVEAELGRVREVKWEARPIDIDILYYGDIQLTSEVLHIPHPHLHERRFTLVPLAEIAPDLIHPKLKLSSKELLLQCPDPLAVRKLE